MTEYFIDGQDYVVKCEKDGKWYRTRKWMTALWVELPDKSITCINISEITERGKLVERPRPAREESPVTNDK